MVTNEQLLDDLREFADELGETPTEAQMKHDGPWSEGTYIRHFGSWNEAVEQAGLEAVLEHSDSEEQLLDDLREFADELGETPTSTQMKQEGPWSVGTYQRYFGSWNEALEQAGLEAVLEHSDSEEQLLDDLREFADELGETPTEPQMKHDGPWSAKTYKRHFGSWNEAVEQAGLEAVLEHSDSEEQLLNDLREFADELGETPAKRKMEQDGPWSANTYKRHFGSWNKALKEAGLDPICEYPVEPVWDDSVENYYGASWPEMRARALERDDEQCRACGETESLHVHHITPRRTFVDPDESNTLDNLITLCQWCHGRFENRWTDASADEFAQRARQSLDNRNA